MAVAAAAVLPRRLVCCYYYHYDYGGSSGGGSMPQRTPLTLALSSSTPRTLKLSLQFSPNAYRSTDCYHDDQQQTKTPTDIVRSNKLWEKLELYGIFCHSCPPLGLYSLLLCPKCNGGKSMERSLSFHISENGDFAIWRCFLLDCSWAGQAFADNRCGYSTFSKSSKISIHGPMTVESLGLVPLSNKLIAYFGERMISVNTLQRNGVMQISGNKLVIAFTYRRNGLLVRCKYRSIDKRFWQVKGTEPVLYGLDDIKEADTVIFVEGEIDKLSMEEAGFLNCVSVPDGAPQKVSDVELPSLEKDSRFQYLWNCKEYLERVSKIILATDGDEPGQALAEELARRLGKERCWRVIWPRKDEFSYYKDANEVLKNMGSTALRDIVGNAELYWANNSEESEAGDV